MERLDPESIAFKKIFEDVKIEEGAEYYSLGKPKTFLKGEVVQEKLGIKEKTLTILAESGEFALGRVGGSKVIIAETLFDFLDRYHFTKRENPEDPPAIDPRGRIRKNLTYVKKKHTEVPTLRPIKDFAKDLGVEERTFQRHCEIGTFPHYRIGSLYKMSEEDYTEALMKIALTGMKSNRGGKQKKPGRPNKMYDKMNKRLEELIEINEKNEDEKENEN